MSKEAGEKKSSWFSFPSTKTYYNYSPTRFVESSFGSWGSSWGGWGKKEETYVTKLRDALTTLRKNANLISNSLAGEAHIKVDYVEEAGESNDFDGEEFKISPNLLLKDIKSREPQVKEGDEYYDAIDALTGQILTGCQIRKNTNKKALKEFTGSKESPERHIYKTLEEAKAFNQIANDWVGFTPYLESHRKEFHASKEKVEELLVDMTADSVTAALCWNFLHPDNKIDLDTKGLEEQFNEHMLKYDSVKPQKHFQHAQEAFELIKKVFPKRKKKSKGKGKPKTGDGLDKLLDDALFGEKIDRSDKLDTEVTAQVNNSSDKEIKDGNIDKYMEIKPEYNVEELSGKAHHAAYDTFVRSHRNIIKGVEKSFLFRNTDTKIENYGLTVGELDEHSLIKIPMGDLEHLYSRKDILSQKDLAVGLLLDQSGSMGGDRMEKAREVVIILREALRKIAGIQLVIYGYSAQENYPDPNCFGDVRMLRYLDKGRDDSAALIGARARCQNLDGYSIRYTTERLLDHDVNSRILFIICDGEPGAEDYYGPQADRHTRSCVEEARRQGVQVFAIGIDNAFDNRHGEQLYGKNGFVVIDDVESSIGILTREIRKFLNQQAMTANC